MYAKSSGGDSGGGGDEQKMCTSYEQNFEHCKKDGVSDVNDIADGIGKVDISDKDTSKVDLSADKRLGDAYSRGAGVEQDGKKARYHFEIAAMGGHENARHALGSIEEVSGNRRLGMYHVCSAERL